MRRIALIGMLASAFGASEAAAYDIAGRPWPGPVIRYHVDARAYAKPVRTAVRHWNRADIGIRFASSSRSRANVIVDYGGRRCEGAAPAGYRRRLPVTPVFLGRGCNRRLIVLTAVHELGHVLGLGHEDGRCARMNAGFDATGTPSRCRPRTLSEWLREPLRPDDRRGARALYRR